MTSLLVITLVLVLVALVSLILEYRTTYPTCKHTFEKWRTYKEGKRLDGAGRVMGFSIHQERTCTLCGIRQLREEWS